MAGYNFPKAKCVDNDCHACKLTQIEDLLALCMSASAQIDLEEQITYKVLDKEENMNGKGKKFWVPIFKNTTTTVELFLHRFLDFLTGSENRQIPFILHYTRKCWQRECYNAHTQQIRDGVLKNVPMAVHDHAEAIKLQNLKTTSDQHYSYKKVQLSGVVDLMYHPDTDTVGFEKNANFFIVENAIKLDVDFTIEILQERLEEMKDENCKVALIWTDGSVKEYLQRNCIGNIETMATALGINLIWCYFGESHGKNVNDPQFARFKCRLRVDVSGDLQVEFEKPQDVWNHVASNFDKWPKEGEISGRRFSYIETLNNDALPKFKGIPSTKSYRCYASFNGIMKRRRLACFCASFFEGEDCEHSAFSGSWESFTTTKLKIESEVEDSINPGTSPLCGVFDIDNIANSSDEES